MRPDRPLWSQLLILVTAQAILVTVWLTIWTVLFGRARQARFSRRFAATMRRAAALTLIALGVRTAAA